MDKKGWVGVLKICHICPCLVHKKCPCGLGRRWVVKEEQYHVHVVNECPLFRHECNYSLCLEKLAIFFILVDKFSYILLRRLSTWDKVSYEKCMSHKDFLRIFLSIRAAMMNLKRVVEILIRCWIEAMNFSVRHLFLKGDSRDFLRIVIEKCERPPSQIQKYAWRGWC